jgi:hypothetical protein
MARTLTALRWLFAPFWALQVFTGTKAFGANPILGSHALNRRGLHIWRARLAHRLTARRRAWLGRRLTEADRAAFAEGGFIEKPDFAPPELYAALKAEIADFRGLAAEVKEGDAITRRIPLIPANLKRLPACRALLKRPEWRALVRYVSSFDVDPIVSIQTIFTHAEPGGIDPQISPHIDTFHPTMKAWLFLDDVPEADGPFAYWPGSHRLTPRRAAWERRRSIEASDPKSRRKGGAFRMAPGDLKRLGLGSPRRFAVAGNTLVVGDTCGLHARSPSSGPAVRLEIWASSRHNPFVPWAGGHWFEKLIGARAVLLNWRLTVLRRRLGLPTPEMRLVKDVGPLDPPAPWDARPAQ